MILDSNFLVALERELRRGREGDASRFLMAATEPLYITPVIAGEMACGTSLSDLGAWRQLIQPFQIIPHTLEVCWQYGEIYRALRQGGNLIGTNDLWIAACALAHDHAVVTRNHSEFSRVPGLVVVPF